jgi:uncharacterized membrane protein
MSIGPVQMLILGFENPQFRGEALAELEKLKEANILRVIDALVVWKDEDGNVAVLQDSDLTKDEAMEYGAVIGGLIGLGMGGEEGLEAGAEAGAEAMEDGHLLDADEVWYATDAIPNNSAAAIALFEHRWAIPFRDAIVRAGGFVLADEWIHPKDLVAVGVMAAEEAEAQTAKAKA